MKLYAYYLPQFHCIPENDEWWGKGFTEWTNVKKAEPLFKGHIQPQKPLNDNYYSLDNLETLEWQNNLMKEYKVDGLIFYHYYFTGKKLLEKPAEMLLKNTNIDIDFFFCWANHTWKKSWDGSSKILLEQKYGELKEWEEHFNYLLPFFKDKRYQKRDNKPIFMIFQSEFKEKKEMFEFFDKKCVENGFNGICVIETRADYKDEYKERNYTTLIHLREPDYVKNRYIFNIKRLPHRILNKIKRILHKVNIKFVVKFNGDKLLKLMCKEYLFNENIIRGLFFQWDNTPRHTYRGYVITPISKKSFLKYMNLLEKEEYLFINAWNEWCEGMMLEPTDEIKYKYLEWIKEWKESK